jgi:hypothetical protein
LYIPPIAGKKPAVFYKSVAFRYGSQGQTKRAVVLQEEEEVAFR